MKKQPHHTRFPKIALYPLPAIVTMSRHLVVTYNSVNWGTSTSMRRTIYGGSGQLNVGLQADYNNRVINKIGYIYLTLTI